MIKRSVGRTRSTEHAALSIDSTAITTRKGTVVKPADGYLGSAGEVASTVDGV